MTARVQATVETQVAHLCGVAWRSRCDADVAAWLRSHDAPRTHSIRARADWLLAQFAAVSLVSYPLDGEAVPEPRRTLAAQGGDADDIAVAFASCAMSMGLECALVAEDHGNGFTHVTVAIKDTGVGREGSCAERSETWLRYDPTYGRGPDDKRMLPLKTLLRECKP